MNSNTPIHLIIVELFERLGLRQPAADSDGVSVLSFDEVDVLLSVEEQAVVFFARVGEAPGDSPAFLEALLAANLFWQESAGATLSLEPFSRSVILARRLVLAEIGSVDQLELQVEAFAQSAVTWTRSIPQLGRVETIEGVGARPDSMLMSRA